LRIDKFLKLSGLIKRRKVSQEMIKAKMVKRNGITLKAGSRISEGDILEIEFYNKRLKIRVKNLDPKKPEYEVLEETRVWSDSP